MYTGTDFDPADPSESERYGFDFVTELAPGDTIVAANWSCNVVSGSDDSASSHLIGSPMIAGTVVSQRVADLLPNTIYRLQCIVQTAGGDQKSLWSHVPGEQPA